MFEPRDWAPILAFRFGEAYAVPPVVAVFLVGKFWHGADAPNAVSMRKLDFSRAEQLRLKLLPLWQDYRFQGAVLLALTAAVVIAFR